MKELLLDTNILIDVLAKRDPHYREAVELFNMGLAGKVKLSVSSLSMVNIHYILKRQLKEHLVRSVFGDLGQIVHILPLDASICERSLQSEMKDFEDAIQCFTALSFDQDMIVTRNLKDFRKCIIPAMTAAEVVGVLKEGD